jgi:DNA-binding SARP family transcriptional activator
MLIKAKIGAPKPGFAELEQPVLNQVLDNTVSVFEAPEGYLLTDSLASVFLEHGISSCWVRLGLEDCDPGTLLLSLMSGAKRLLPTIGETTFAKMRRKPGPIAGWEPLYIQLAVEFNHLLPRGTILVLEGVDYLNYSPVCLRLLGDNFLPHLGFYLHTVIISNQPLPRAVMPAGTVIYDIRNLQLDEELGMRVLNRMETGLSGEAINRTILLSEGRAAALASLMNASVLVGPSQVDREVRRAGNLQDLLIRVARISLEGANEKALQALSLALQVEYSHPSMTRFSQPEGPWLQPLEDGWNRLRNLWAQPLQKVLKAKLFSKSPLAEQAANFLINNQGVYQVVNLYLKQRNPVQAAHVIEKMAEEMMDLGQWATLNAWLKQLPTNVLHEWPWLIYFGGKISATQGNLEVAHKSFARSSELFLQQENKRGACLSMLAESESASWRGELMFSKERALSAFVLAQRAGLRLYETWSAWQMGRLATQAGDLDEALAWFTPAAAAADKAGYVPLGELLHLAEDLIRRQRELEREKIHHQKALVESERAQEEVLARLQNLLESPPENLDELLDTYGWTDTPLMPGTPVSIYFMPDSTENTGLSGLFTILTHFLGRQNPVQRIGMEGRWTEIVENGRTHPTASDGESGRPVPLPEDDTVSASGLEMITPGSVGEGSLPAPSLAFQSGMAETQPDQDDSTDAQAGLKVNLLGPFCVTLDDRILKEWTHKKGQEIFKYLVVHRNQLTSREVLMDTFWHDAAPDSARNSLNVALYNLRRILKTSDDYPLIQFHDGGYRLATDVDVWVDIEEFEERVQEGRKLEAGRLNTAALQEYEKAIALYKGDFLEDDPYEEWPMITRERLRVAYLDTLDRSSQMYLSQSDYDACIALCHMILGYDSCREDAHCRLMHCYSQLGQVYLALRQYQECVDALKAELDVSPAATTTALYEKIRQRK